MRGWLKLLKVTEIAMESTGVNWRPVWNVLEDHGFRLLLVNPAQVKALQGPGFAHFANMVNLFSSRQVAGSRVSALWINVCGV